MSRSSAAKKARRKKRQANRDGGWLPEDVRADIEAVVRIADEIIPRGWEFDHEFSTDDFVTWYYPPSGIQESKAFDDDSTESVTRIWLTNPEELHVILVGSAETDGADEWLSVEELFGWLDAIEAYRVGDVRPAFAG